MAYTKVYAVKRYSNRTRANTFSKMLGYITNENKTEGGLLVTTYECSIDSPHEDFEMVAKEYDHLKGGVQGGRITYHIIQSFKPGETDACTAHEIGVKLAREYVKGGHQFVIATHVDTEHINNHIIFNAVNLEGNRKFRDAYMSGKHVIPGISDRICKEYGLSVIEKDNKSRGLPYHKKQGEKLKAVKSILKTERGVIVRLFEDGLASRPKNLAMLLDYVSSRGYEARIKGGGVVVSSPFLERNVRLKTAAADSPQVGRLVALAAAAAKQGRLDLNLDISSLASESKLPEPNERPVAINTLDADGTSSAGAVPWPRDDGSRLLPSKEQLPKPPAEPRQGRTPTIPEGLTATKQGAKPRLEEVIRKCLDQRPLNLEQFFRFMESYGCHAKERGKNITFTTPFQKPNIRLSSLSKETVSAVGKLLGAVPWNHASKIGYMLEADKANQTVDLER